MDLLSLVRSLLKYVIEWYSGVLCSVWGCRFSRTQRRRGMTPCMTSRTTSQQGVAFVLGTSSRDLPHGLESTDQFISHHLPSPGPYCNLQSHSSQGLKSQNSSGLEHPSKPSRLCWHIIVSIISRWYGVGHSWIPGKNSYLHADLGLSASDTAAGNWSLVSLSFRTQGLVDFVPVITLYFFSDLAIAFGYCSSKATQAVIEFFDNLCVSAAFLLALAFLFMRCRFVSPLVNPLLSLNMKYSEIRRPFCYTCSSEGVATNRPNGSMWVL